MRLLLDNAVGLAVRSYRAAKGSLSTDERPHFPSSSWTTEQCKCILALVTVANLDDVTAVRAWIIGVSIYLNPLGLCRLDKWRQSAKSRWGFYWWRSPHCLPFKCSRGTLLLGFLATRENNQKCSIPPYRNSWAAHNEFYDFLIPKVQRLMLYGLYLQSLSRKCMFNERSHCWMDFA